MRTLTLTLSTHIVTACLGRTTPHCQPIDSTSIFKIGPTRHPNRECQWQVVQACTNGGAYRSDSTLSTSLLAFRQTEQDFEEQLYYHDFLSCPGSSKSSQCSQLKGNLCDHFRDTTIYTGSCNVCSRTSQREVAAAITLIKHKLNPSRE